MAFGAGSRMVVVSPSVYGGAELASILRSEHVTHAFVTPAALASVDPTGLDDLRVVVVGGEACSPSLIAAWALELPDGRRRQFFNAYGPTEATVATNISTALTSEDRVTIGGPVDGLAAFVFDERLLPYRRSRGRALCLGYPDRTWVSRSVRSHRNKIRCKSLRRSRREDVPDG